MSLEDFDPMKHGPVAVFFAAALGFLMWLLGKAKALFKNGDAAEIKAMLTEQRDELREHRQETRDGFKTVSGEIVALRERMTAVETRQEGWDGNDRRQRASR